MTAQPLSPPSPMTAQPVSPPSPPQLTDLSLLMITPRQLAVKLSDSVAVG
jgi:hypothetical protein